ncbi:MAG: signal recognition particle-docking protein FtsY [Thermoprotei archaeon]|nr:MAG: signal recognition particle-docking protein FtsY [Thermoprotei archaeon]
MKDVTSKLAEAIGKRELSDKELGELSEEIILQLVEADVAFEVAELIANKVLEELKNTKVPRFSSPKSIVQGVVRKVLLEILRKGIFDRDIVKEIKSKEKHPYVIVFMGVNGVGKTTTIAKIARLLMKHRLKPLVIAADTFRAGAQEQLEIHAKRVKASFFKGKYGADPGAIVHDALVHAKKTGYNVALIDTAGRMHTDSDLMNELRKVVRVAKPDMKLLVLDALTGNDAIEQARTFEKIVGVDAVILTKIDADASGGPALTIITTIEKPIAFIGTGQGYDDLEPYDPYKLLNCILRE